MNVYDFDKTIYNGDSTLDFFYFVLKRNNRLIKYLPIQILGLILYKFNIYSKEKFKSIFFIFIKDIDLKIEVDEFWKIYRTKIKKWYINKRKTTDVIISASPDFLLEPFCNQINVNLICTKVDDATGKLVSKNCFGAEKVKRFKREFDSKIDEFYSDSKSDLPMANIALNAFLVKGEKVIEWSIN